MAAQPDALVDASVAIPLVVADQLSHRTVANALRDRVLGLAGHAAFETFSILTRLPPPARRSPDAVARLLGHDFPATRFLTPEAAAELLSRLGTVGIAGGAVYDALVGTAATHHRATLLTRDRRAVDVIVAWMSRSRSSTDVSPGQPAECRMRAACTGRGTVRPTEQPIKAACGLASIVRAVLFLAGLESARSTAARVGRGGARRSRWPSRLCAAPRSCE